MIRPAIVTALTVGASSAQGLPARTRQFLLIHNASASATIAFCPASAGAAVINGAGSITLAAGATMRFGDADLIPMDAINFIASGASTPVTVWE